MSFYFAVRKVFKGLVTAAFRVRVSGGEIPRDGKILVCANHTSMLDVAVLVVSFERKIRFMAKKEIFKFKPLGKFFAAMGAFPVDRGSADVGALKKAIALVKEGEAVSVFPQGKRYVGADPSRTPVKHGVGMIAYHTGCDVVPVYIKTKGNHLHLFGKTEIIVGETIKNGDLGLDKGGTKEYTAAADTIFSKICALGGYTYPPALPEENLPDKDGADKDESGKYAADKGVTGKDGKPE